MFSWQIWVSLENAVVMISFGISLFNYGNPKLRFRVVEASGSKSSAILLWKFIINSNIPPDTVDIESHVIETIGVNFLVLNESLDVFLSFSENT